MKNILTIIVMIFSISSVGAQSKFVLSGNISDAATGENLPGATVLAVGIPGTGATSNPYGFYSLSLDSGFYRIHFRYVGYAPETVEVALNRNIHLSVELSRTAYELENIEIRGRRTEGKISSTEMGVSRLSPEQIESIPVIFGEPDVLKTIQLTPGVKPAGEGNSGFHVRGGGVGQNLILLDEAPVYSASHLLGFFSVFNSGAIRKVSLLKGAVPASYGGRAASVLDIRMKEGNLKNFGVTGNLGLIASNLTVEGPLVKEKSSFIVSGRRTYADLFLKLSGDEEIRNSFLYFYDLNMKANYKLNSKNRIYLSGYLGRDDFGYKEEFGFDWGSMTGTLRWNHIFSDRLFSNTSLIFSNYSYNIRIRQSFDLNIRSQIKDLNLKQDFSWYANASHTLHFGLNLISHTVLPGNVTVEGSYGFTPPENIRGRKALEWAFYASNTQRIAPNFSAEYGLRISLFSNIGPGEFYLFEEDGTLVQTMEAARYEIFKTQGGLEPRVALNYQLTPQSSVKASFNRMHQFLHLLSNTTTTTPVDLWLPSSNNVKPQIADQVSLGYFRNFHDNVYESSLELYYKDLQNQIDYKNGADLIFNSTVESELVFGRGWAYGAELLLKRNAGRLKGWIGYTWSRTMRQFGEINNGRPYPARYDRTHDLSVVAMYDLSPKLKFSAAWVYYTGNAVTFPGGRYELDGKTFAWYTERNGYRMPDYHRLDLGLTWLLKKTDKFESGWTFSVYNAYARENAYFIDFRPREDNQRQTEAVQISLFRAIPSVSYRFKF